ncbi:MAG: hypothetical protein KC543_03580 [Myxococcales bacterium]|nr:hypothetical protein [Myxococcales bacterium]
MGPKGFSLVALCALMVSVAGCGSDSPGGSAKGLCKDLCAKVAMCIEAPIPGVDVEAACKQSCSENSGTSGGEPTCSESEATACINAITNASCDFFTGEGDTPPECDKCIDDSGNHNQPDGGTTPPGGTCGDLAECCQGLSGVTRQSCDAAVSVGSAQACSSVLQGFRSGGLCN